MATPSRSSQRIRFGEFELDLSTHELWMNGTKQTLAPQPFHVLELLIEKRGQLVTRDALVRHLWPTDTFVDYEQGLKKAVKRLREALNDSADKPRLIETLPRQGYRFIGAAEVDTEDHARSKPAEPIVVTPRLVTEEPKPAHANRLPIPSSRALWFVGVLICAAVALLFVASRFMSTRMKPASPEIIPLVTLPGHMTTPSISPDGTEIAFAYQAEGSKQTDIYIKGVNDDRVTRITTSPGSSVWPSWSPDGQQIAYTHWVETSPDKWQRTIMLMTRLGGNQHLLRAAASGVGGRVSWKPDGKTLLYADNPDGKRPGIFAMSLDGVSWTPDGKTLLYADNPDGERPGIFAISLDGSGVRRLTTSTAERDVDPAVSPDGETVAFVRNGSIMVSDLYTVSISGGEPRRLTTIQASVYFPVWTPDGRSILFAGDLKGARSQNLYSVPATGGAPEPLPFASFEASYPSMSRNGDKLVLLKILPENVSIWRMGLNPIGDSTKLIASTRKEGNPVYSPDGTSIAFASTRDGTVAIWKCKADGSDPVRLASIQALGGAPAWSPDGSRLAFDNRPGRSRIDVVSADGGAVETLDAGNFDDTVPAWSTDGTSIYFASNRSGRYEIWSKDLRSGEVVQITRNGGVLPQVSPDGHYIYFIRPLPQYSGEPDRGLWRVPIAGGAEEHVLDGPDWQWFVAKKGVYFVDATGPPLVLKYFDLASRRVKPLKQVGPLSAERSLAVSPDETSLLYGQLVPEKTDILLVKGMRW